MPITIKVQCKKAFGHIRYYPLCPNATLLCELASHRSNHKRISLSKEHIELIKAAGWIVEVSED